jgi:hypothetical protein
MAESKFNFGAVKANVDRVTRELPLILANDAKNEFLKNFADQGFDGKSWEEVQRRIPGTGPYKYPLTKDLGRHTRNILQGPGSGRLRVAVANMVDTGHPIDRGYLLIVKNEYAIYHNEGAEHLPQRRFVGDTPALKALLKDKIAKVINGVWKR